MGPARGLNKEERRRADAGLVLEVAPAWSRSRPKLHFPGQLEAGGAAAEETEALQAAAAQGAAWMGH